MSPMIEPSANDQNKLKKEKVKSLSRNWENKTTDTNSTQHIRTIHLTSRPNVIEKIEKFNSNNLIQLISQQTNCAVNRLKKTRLNSGNLIQISR